MSDTMLSGLMGRVPTRCIVLLEDLDAAFTKSTSRDSNSTGVPTVPTVGEAAADGNTLSLSGLLNSIDGISATEGRLLFATTNYLDRLDSALSRPGRMASVFSLRPDSPANVILTGRLGQLHQCYALAGRGYLQVLLPFQEATRGSCKL